MKILFPLFVLVFLCSKNLYAAGILDKFTVQNKYYAVQNKAHLKEKIAIKKFDAEKGSLISKLNKYQFRRSDYKNNVTYKRIYKNSYVKHTQYFK